MLDVKRLILLRDLAEYGTVTAVADIHGVTPSAVSQQLRTLEAESGVALLRRAGRAVHLTSAGAALAAQCELVLAALEHAQSTASALGDQVSGEFMIGCFPSALTLIAVPIAALRQRHPELRPRIVEVDPEDSLPQLKRRELDLALIYRYRQLGTALPDGLTGHKLLDDQVVLAVPEALRAIVERDGIAALRREPWIGTPEPSSCRQILVHACTSAGFTPTIEHSCWDPRVALVMVAAGLGVTVLPSMLADAPPAGIAILPFPGYGRVIEAVIRSGTGSHPAVHATLDALVKAPQWSQVGQGVPVMRS